MTRYLWRLSLLSVVLTVAAVAAEEITAKGIVATTEVGQVNGAVITAREYVEALRRNRFRQLATPEWQQAAWDECVRFKLVQLFARELGKLDDVSEGGLARGV